MKAKGEEWCRDMANERVSSRTSLSRFEASFGNLRRFTGTLKRDISSINHFSSPPAELSIGAWRARAAALPGVELPWVMAGDIMLLFLPAAMRGGRKPVEAYSFSGLLRSPWR